MGRTIKINEIQFKEVRNKIAEGYFNPNKRQYLGAYINKFRKLLHKDDLTVPELHDALQSGYFKFQTDNNNTYRKEDLDYVLGPGLRSLKRYFGIEDMPNIDSAPQQPITMRPQPFKDNTEEYEPEKTDMENASDELLRDQEVFYPSFF